MPSATFLNLPAAKRQRIIDVALAEFAAYSFNEASVSKIVARAGIAKGSLYQYFEDKFDLYLYLLRLTVDIKLRLVKESLAQLPPGAGVFETLNAAADAGMKMARDNPRLQELGDRLLMEGPELMGRIVAAFGDVYDLTIASWIAEAKRSGEIAAHISAHMATYMINLVFGALGRDMAAGRIPRDQTLEMMRQVFTILEYGMRPRADDLRPASKGEDGR